MKHILSYRDISESNSLVEMGIEFDCLSFEPVQYGNKVFFPQYSYYYQGKNHAEVFGNMLREEKIRIAKSFLGQDLFIDISGATEKALLNKYNTSDMDSIGKIMMSNSRIDFGSIEDDFLEVLSMIESNLSLQLKENNTSAKVGFLKLIEEYESDLEVGIPKDI